MAIVSNNVQLDNGRELPVTIEDMKGIVVASERLSFALSQAIVAIATGTAKALVKGVARECTAIVTDSYTEVVLVLHDGRTLRTVGKYESSTRIYSQAITRAEQNGILREQQRKVLMQRLEDSYLHEMDRLAEAEWEIRDE